MALTEFTTPDSIRSVLGVSAKELEDTTLLQKRYETMLIEDVLALHAQMLEDFRTTFALPTKTDDEQRFLDLFEAFAAHQVAKQCLGSIEMFAPRRITDGKSELERSTDPYKRLRDDVAAVLNILRIRLREAYARINPDATPPAPAERLAAIVSTPAFNPITG